MPGLLGTGIIPSGATGTELAAVTRRAFIPKVVVQTYYSTPELAALLANAQTASGGISSVTVPVQGSPMTTAQATDFTGSFNQPAGLTGISEADFNLKAIVVPIQFLGMEGIIQLNAAVVPLIEARMNDAGNQLAEFLSTQLWTNGTNGTINPDGYPLMTATTGTYGNIARAANTWWRGFRPTAPGGVPHPTRQHILQGIVSAANNNGGEMPNMVTCSPATWVDLATDFVGQEQYMITPGSAFDASTQGARAAFTALMVAGVPVYMDRGSPDGEFLFKNTRYVSAYIHEAAAFAFTGFASTLPNLALGYIGAVVVVLEFICVKPSSMSLWQGFGSLSLT